jgi:hypothetical protein
MMLSRFTTYALVACIAQFAFFSSCKKRSASTRLDSSDEYLPSPPLSTPELHRYLKDRIAQQVSSKTFHDGTNPSEDIWDYYVDPTAVSKQWGHKIDTHREYFGIKLSALRFPEGTPLPDPCPAENQTTTKDGKKACLVLDNFMRYMWEPKAKGTVSKDPKAWFVNVIPQFYGSKQPAMQRFIREGDIVVYFRPEDRDDDVGEVAQWRTSHAATVFKRESDGVLMTIDTPAGYAKAFNGVDHTPFHVYRFIPRDFQDWSVVDAYGAQVARWGTLALSKFSFQGNYGVMADHMRSESDIDTFMKKYLTSANLKKGEEPVLPRMYCSWYVWTNLNLAWMRPMTPSGLGDAQYRSLLGSSFAHLMPSHQYAGGSFDQGYKVPSQLQGRMPKRNNFAVVPMTAPELLLALTDRSVGRNEDSTTPAEFVAKAKIKAAILSQFGSNESILRKFQAEIRDPQSVESPLTDGKPPVQYNESLKTTILTFAQMYDSLANDVASGGLDVSSAIKKVSETFTKLVKQEWTTNRNVSRKWSPPYGFMHHAEYGYQHYNVQDKAQPVLAYVGTVVHEKFLRKKGAPIGKSLMTVQRATVATQADLDLDKQIYERLGCSIADDGQGWKALLSHLNPEATPSCGSSSNVTKMNRHESKAVLTMIKDWIDSDILSEREIYVRNTFGLDPVLVRRLLVSYWNDPTVFFKPSIYEGSASTIASAVGNLKILLHDEVITMNATPANESKYTSEGHPRRESQLACEGSENPNRNSCKFISSVRGFSENSGSSPNNPDRP